MSEGLDGKEVMYSARAVSLLSRFSSCELADALSKLNIPCHIPNVTLRSPNLYNPAALTRRIIGPAHTVEFVPATDTVSPRLPPNTHHVDCAPEGSVIVLKTPLTTPNAVWGGLMSARATALKSAGVVVEGNVRDLREHWDLDFPVFASGQSTLGAGPMLRASKIGSEVALGASSGWPVVVRAGDIIVGDIDGVVRVPLDMVEQVADFAAKGVAIDAKCAEDIKNGRSILDTFAEHRGKKKS
ncbi:ribonuclease E inhibitor RraA/Dimethylmenaquinone methyltransferase [Gaertneriomyces semiglobifer]|nr:ribonuclease E inhibitor RraA/Dimethylmenaquinone methyltransferase [Gaertneriomyces semiglobifer]